MEINTKLNLINELKDALDCLDVKEHKDNVKLYDINEKTTTWMNRQFNHAYWDSLIYSGRLDELEPFMIQPLQDIFLTMIDHNNSLTYINKILANSKETYPAATIGYCEWMDKHEKILLEDIPKMIKKLQE